MTSRLTDQFKKAAVSSGGCSLLLYGGVAILYGLLLVALHSREGILVHGRVGRPVASAPLLRGFQV